MNQFTYGSEIEAADWDTRLVLPEGCNLDTLDYTIANSSGLANDPTHTDVLFGGEVNVRISNSIQEAVDAMMEVYQSIAPYTINYTCNLHIHVGVPGLSEDLTKLKQLTDYIYQNQDDLFNKVLPDIPQPDKADKPAMRRARQRKVSHRSKMLDKIYAGRMAATTLKEFKQAHSTQQPLGFTAINARRSGVNMNSLFKHGTVEFRHFTGCDDPQTLLWCFKWCQAFMFCALNNPHIGVLEIAKRTGGVNFPEWKPFLHNVDEIFQQTHCDRVSKKVRKAKYEELLSTGVLTEGDFK